MERGGLKFIENFERREWRLVLFRGKKKYFVSELESLYLAIYFLQFENALASGDTEKLS